MTLRPKTKRRLLVLGTLVLVVGGVLFWVYRGPAAKAAAEAARHRDAGMSAYFRGDHAAAMPELSEYLRLAKRDKKDWTDEELESLYAFADCRRRIPRPRKAHLAEAASLFNQLLEQRPADVRGRRAMMEVVDKLRRDPDAAQAANVYPALTEFADRLLAADPNDVSALLVKGNELLRRKPADAAGAKGCADRAIAAVPNDYRGHVLSVSASVAAGADPEQVVAAAKALQAARAADAGFAVVVATAYRELTAAAAATRSSTRPAASRPAWLASDEALFAESRTWYLAAAALPPPDATFAAELAAALDDARLYRESIDYLRAAAKAVPYRELEWSLVRKLWQADAHDEVLARTAGPATAADVELAAWRAMALQSQATAAAAGPARAAAQAAADAALAALAARNDADAKWWVAFLGAEAFAATADRQNPATAGAVAARYRGLRQADRADQENPLLQARIGDAVIELGEAEEALWWWDRAARKARDWAHPRLRGAGVLLAMRQPRDAHRWAADAAERSLDDRAAAVLAARARVEFVRRDANVPPATLAASLAVVADVQRRWPNEPSTLPQWVLFTLRSGGPSAAGERIDAALAAAPPPTPDALVELLRLDRAEKLGREAALVAALQKQPDDGPAALAVWQAAVLAQDGKPDEGVAVLEKARAADGGKRDHVWQMQIARLRESVGDAGAVAAWAKLAAERPADLEVQDHVLNSAACRADRTLWRQTIDRVKAVTGEESSRWRRAEAQWLLAGPSPTPDDRKRAVGLLTEVAKRSPRSADAQAALGVALLADAAYEPAAKAFEASLKLQPNDPDVTIRLATSLRAAGKNAAARAALAPLTGPAAQLPPNLRLALARELAAAGDVRGAIAVLVPLPPSAARDALLGAYYWTAGQTAEADATYTRLLNDPATEPADLFVAADFFAATGKPDKAKFCLDRVQTMNLPPADVQLELARFDEARGTPADALAKYTKATQLDPSSATAWAALAGYQVRTGDLDAAARTIDEGLAASASAAATVPAAASAAADARERLTLLRSHVQIARGLALSADARELLVLLGANPRHAGATAMLVAMSQHQAAVAAAAADAAAKDRARDQFARSLIDLAGRHPNFWRLQELAIDLHLRAGRSDDAARLATAAVDRFPTDPKPAAVAADVFGRLGNWEKVAEYAREWKARVGGGDTLAADLVLADAQLRLKDRLGAARTLDPQVSAKPLPPPTGTTRPAALTPQLLRLHVMYAKALIEQGRSIDAADRLRPLLAMGAVGRAAWLSLAGSHERAVPARQWVDEAARTMSPDAPAGERLAVAAAWLEAGLSTGDADLFRRSLDATTPLVAGEAPPVQALLARASAAHYLAEYATAEQAWRAIVARGPDASAQNNLAYILLVRDDPKDRAEALDLAQRAEAAVPNDPAIVTTLALARARLGQRESAIQAYRAALTREPQHLEAMLGLAEELARGTSTERAEARQLLGQLRAKFRTAGPQLPEVAKQFETVSKAIELAPPR